jgi:hypothetical protein
MDREERVALHKKMAEAYRDAYLRKAVHCGMEYGHWTFADDALYASPYFTGNQVLKLKEVLDGAAQVATMEARAYTVNFADWAPAEFKCWPSENGFAMRTTWEGHTRDGKLMGFYSIGFVDTNDQGQITRWETFVNDEEYGPFLQVAIGTRGPFASESYVTALNRHLGANGLL